MKRLMAAAALIAACGSSWSSTRIEGSWNIGSAIPFLNGSVFRVDTSDFFIHSEIPQGLVHLQSGMRVDDISVVFAIAAHDGSWTHEGQGTTRTTMNCESTSYDSITVEGVPPGTQVRCQIAVTWDYSMEMTPNPSPRSNSLYASFVFDSVIFSKLTNFFSLDDYPGQQTVSRGFTLVGGQTYPMFGRVMLGFPGTPGVSAEGEVGTGFINNAAGIMRQRISISPMAAGVTIRSQFGAKYSPPTKIKRFP